MQELINKFNKYVKNYDLKEKHIMSKFHHSYRVMEYSKNISNSLNLTDKEIYLSEVIGLFHDIGRFEQYTKYKTFDDSVSIDHGGFGSKIIDSLLNEFNELEKQIILKSVKNHNKLKIDTSLNSKELLFAKIIRDADKLDILKEQGILYENEKINEKLIDILLKKELVKNEMVKSKSDSILASLSFLFDINFSYSFSIILKNKIIENKINLLEIYGNIDLKDLQDFLINYAKERL